MDNSVLTRNLKQSIKAKQALLDDLDLQNHFQQAAQMIADHYKKGGRLYIAGNGGSAADAQHFAAELVSRLVRERAPLPAEALSVDTSILTAIGNDYGYEQIFSRQIRGKMREHDVFLGITTSGNSPNIILALETVREMGLKSVILSGHQGGKIGKENLADHIILAPGETTATIQEVHLVMEHSLCELIETALFPNL